MPRDGKGFAGKLFEAGTRAVSRAAETVMRDPRGQEAIARAIGLAQRSRQRMEQAQELLMRAAGIPGRQDYQELARHLARIKRKARELAEKLGEAEDAGEGPHGGNGSGRGG